MTIITQTSGGVTRRCDGTCHQAKGLRCTCICGGRYHGKGKQAQERLTRDWFGETWRQKRADIEAGGGSLTAVVTGGLTQLASVQAS